MTPRADGGFSARAVAWAAGIAAVSFLLAFVLAAFGDDLADPATFGADSFSYSAIGHRALREFLTSAGLDVHVRRIRTEPDVDGSSVLLVAEPGRDPTSGDPVERLAGLYATTVERGARLVLVMPKWRGIPSTTRRRWVDSVAPIIETEAARAANALLDELALPGLEVYRVEESAPVCRDARGTAYATDLSPPQFIRTSQDFEPVVQCDEHVLIARGKPGTAAASLYVVSDPDLLNNYGLARADHARVVDWLIGEDLAVSSVVIDEIHHGHERRVGLLDELLRFPLVLAVLHGLLVLGLAVWGGSRRLGKPVADPPRVAGGKVALVDNAAQLLARGGHSVPMARRYFDQTLRAVASHYFVPTEIARHELITRLQAISDSRDHSLELAELQGRLEHLERGRVRSAERAVKLALELHHWRQEMTDATTRDP